jgi:crotonobetainyl-CoA:carnitine CoA-transferase CaiB-like acyl-CoA transferase
MAQGMGGFMSLTGMPDGEPLRSGVPVSDIFTGVYSVIGILAALQQRERTGKGCYVDTALVDSTVGVLANQGMNFLASGKQPARLGNAHPNIVPYQVFTVADGYIIIATGNDSQYVKLCGVLGAPELGKDPRYIDNKARLAARAELVGKLTALTMQHTMQELTDKLEAVGVPAGPINNLDQVFDDPHVKHRGMKLDLPSALAKLGTIPGVRTPIMIDGKPMASEHTAPRLGEHTTEILMEIGEA